MTLTSLVVQTGGPACHDITPRIRDWLGRIGAESGVVTLFVRNTSCSLLIQENADPDVLRALRRLTPELSRGLVAEYNWLDPLKVAAHHGCSMLALNWTLCTPERLLKAQKAGLHVSVWTVNEPALMRRLADFGVDSIITDFPGLAVDTLKR